MARGVSEGQPNDSLQESADGQAEVVGVDSVSRFLGRTRTPFEKASSDNAAPGAKPASPADFIVFMQCFGG